MSGMPVQVQLFWILLIAGVILTGAEIFVPGGIVGSLGAIALIGAIVMGFVAFPGYGVPIAFAIIALGAVGVAIWIRYFPRSSIGRKMTVDKSLADCKASAPGLQELMGKRGTAASDLRPAGFASIEGRRVDVVTQGSLIAKGSKIEVVRVEGSRVVVRALPASS